MKVIKNNRTLSKEEYTITDKVITLTEPLKHVDIVIGMRELLKNPEVIKFYSTPFTEEYFKSVLNNNKS